MLAKIVSDEVPFARRETTGYLSMVLVVYETVFLVPSVPMRPNATVGSLDS